MVALLIEEHLKASSQHAHTVACTDCAKQCLDAADPERYAVFGQELLEASAASTLTPEAYEALGAQLRDEARAYIDGLLEANDIDVIAASANLFSVAYAVAGYPAVTVPIGLRPALGPQGATTIPKAYAHIIDPRVLWQARRPERALGKRLGLAASWMRF